MPITENSSPAELLAAGVMESPLARVLEMHEKWCRKLPEGIRANLSNETYSGLPFPGLFLPSAMLNSSTWIECQMTGAVLTGCQMDSVDVRQAFLSKADLTGVSAEKSRWDEAWLQETVFSEAKFGNASLRSIHAAGSRWQDTQLNDSDFSGADLMAASFQQSRITNCSLAMAQLDGAQLSHMRMQMCRLVGAQAMGANWSNSAVLDCDFSQAYLSQGKFYKADLSRSRFWKAEMVECDLREAKLGACDLSRANLTGAKMGNAQLRAADLRGTNLLGAREMTADQLAQAFTDHTTTLPNGSAGPFMKRSGAEKPARV